MQKYLFQSKNKEIIIDDVLKELNVTEDEIISNSYIEKNGLFGKKYVLEVVKLDEVAKFGKEILEELLISIGVKSNIETKIRDKVINYEIISNNNSTLIGKNGHILDAIQTYIRQVIFNNLDIYVKIQIDVQNYKEKQNYFLIKKIKKIARDVTLTKQQVKLDPMNSYERKIIHEALQNFKYITTESEGIEPNRCIVIKYKEK